MRILRNRLGNVLHSCWKFWIAVHVHFHSHLLRCFMLLMVSKPLCRSKGKPTCASMWFLDKNIGKESKLCIELPQLLLFLISFWSLGYLLTLTSYGYWITGFDIWIGFRNMIIRTRNGSLRFLYCLPTKKKTKKERLEAYFYLISNCIDRSFIFHWPCMSTQKDNMFLVYLSGYDLITCCQLYWILWEVVFVSSVPLTLSVFFISLDLSPMVFSALQMNDVASACLKF